MGIIEKELEQWARINLPVYEFMDLQIDSVTNGVYRCSVPLTVNLIAVNLLSLCLPTSRQQSPGEAP